jgi:hypothetical protein
MYIIYYTCTFLSLTSGQSGFIKSTPGEIGSQEVGPAARLSALPAHHAGVVPLHQALNLSGDPVFFYFVNIYDKRVCKNIGRFRLGMLHVCNSSTQQRWQLVFEKVVNIFDESRQYF